MEDRYYEVSDHWKDDGKETRAGERKTVRVLFGQWFGLLLVSICGIVIYYLLKQADTIVSFVRYLLGLVRPVIYGAVIAYLLNPMMKFYQRQLLRPLTPKGKRPSKKAKKLTRGLGIFFALVSGILIIAVLGWMIVPQVIDSIMTLINTLPQQANHYYLKVVNWIQNNPYLMDKLQNYALEATKTLDAWMNEELFPWLRTDLLSNVNSFTMHFANGVMSFLGVLYNLFIGIIVAIYLLAGKETYSAQAKKMIYGLFRKKPADIILHYARITNDMFSGFISGKIVDSTIIGFLCFGAMNILQLPYAMLVSVIVGVTNVIPVFGPYIGAVPGTLLILLVNPIQSLYFLILIIVIQQLDGNVIGPAILGESTGISAFWVLFSILLFGGIWGIAGMLVGVPLFAVIYRILKDYIELRLYRKELKGETMAYVNLKRILPTEKGVRYLFFGEDELENARLRREQEAKITLTSIVRQEANRREPEEKTVERRPERKQGFALSNLFWKRFSEGKAAEEQAEKGKAEEKKDGADGKAEEKTEEK